jgi:NAD(P)H-hydrate epimerase
MEGVLTREAMRELDRRAIEEYGIPSLVLMENAGRACADAALPMLGGVARELPAIVLCGPGNNGGDGLVVARTLENRGHAARVFLVGPYAKLEQASADVRTNAHLWRALGREIERMETPQEVEFLRAVLARAPLVVDALFGTGLARPLGEPWVEAIRAVNTCGRPVLSIDLPSGLDANTGAVLGEAVEATVTVTLAAKKHGMERGEGPARCGRVVVAEIGIPRFLLEQAQEMTVD